MADKKISQLTAATTPLAGTEVLPIVQSGSTVKVSVDNLTTGKAVTVGSLSSSGAISGTALTATGNVDLNGGSFVFNESGADKDARFEGDTDANLLFTDASADCVGVGTNTPGYKLDVSVAGNSLIGRYKNDTGRGYVRFDGKDDMTLQFYRNGASCGFIQTDSSGTDFLLGTTGTFPMYFYTNNIERGQWDTSGNLKVKNGNFVVSTAAKGIDFSANTHAAGMTSELLNWYEEGTWTPTLAGSSTAGTYELAIASGWYTRVGRSITVIFNVKLAAAVTGGGTGFAVLSGLPFNTAITAAAAGAVTLGGVNYTVTTNYVTVMPRSVGSAQLIFEEVNINGAVNDIAISAFGVNDTIQGTLTYIV